MNGLIVRVFVLAVLPVVTLLAGGMVMDRWSGRVNLGTTGDARPLYLRWQGYDADAVKAHWEAIGAEAGLGAERSFLKIDLFFPFLYGGVLAACIGVAWHLLGRAAPLPWLLLPVLLGCIADWVENSVQLGQLGHFLADPETVNASWVRVASVATQCKLGLLFAAYAVVAVLGVQIYRKG
ncbi:MAG: hypothetical protein HYV27_20365 [Candidatus Hydrogenedentes bacterium]|nr:hypothetical protein [Candidatus Hydrogenedentota bacterium]